MISAGLATAGAVLPSDVLPVGLTMLSALAQLCRSDSASLLQRCPDSTSWHPTAHPPTMQIRPDRTG
jgi:hypothetical protein